VRKAVSSCLLGMRAELLVALTTCLDLLEYSTDPSIWPAALLRCLHYSTDLLFAVRRGTTKGVVRTCLATLQAQLRGLPIPTDDDLQIAAAEIAAVEAEESAETGAEGAVVGGYISNLQLALAYRKKCETEEWEPSCVDRIGVFLVLLAEDLWAALPLLNTPQVGLLAPLLSVAVRVSGPRRGMQRSFSLLSAIGRGTAQPRAKVISGEERSGNGESLDGDSDSNSDGDSSMREGQGKRQSAAAALLENIRARNTLKDHLRLFGAPAIEATDTDAITLAESDDEKGGMRADVSRVRRKGRTLVGELAEAAVLTELFKIVAAAAQRCSSSDNVQNANIYANLDLVDNGDDEVEAWAGEVNAVAKIAHSSALLTPDVLEVDLWMLWRQRPAAYATSVFSGADAVSWVGKCVFCLFQPFDLSTRRVPGLRQGREQQPGQHHLLLNSPWIHVPRKAAAVGLAAKWVHWAVRDLSLLLKALLAALRRADAVSLQARQQQQRKERGGRDWVQGETGQESDDSDSVVGGGDRVGHENSASLILTCSSAGGTGGTDGAGRRSCRPGPSQRPFAYLSYLLLDLTPPGFCVVREWLQQQASLVDREKSSGSGGASAAFVSGSKRKRAVRSSLSSSLSASSSSLDAQGDSAATSSAGSAALAKQAQLLLHRMDQFLWALRQLLGEIDRPRKHAGAASAQGAQKGKAVNFQFPAALRATLQAVDGPGRALLQQVEEQEKLQYEQEQEEEESRAVDADSSRGGQRRKYATALAPRASFAKQLGSRGSRESVSRGRRIRSRNRVVDEWLQEEAGHGGGMADAFADLEDFLVD